MKKAGKDERVWLVLRNIILLCGLILILFPLWLVLINSFKTLEEAGKNFFALPSRLNFDNYLELFANSSDFNNLDSDSRSVRFLCDRTEF